MKKLIYIFVAVIVVMFVACDKNENTKDTSFMIETIEEENSEYLYNKSIRLYSDDGEYVDIKLSSNDEGFIEYYTDTYDDYIINNNKNELNESNGIFVEWEEKNKITVDDSVLLNCPKICFEVLDVSDKLNDYTIARKKSTKQQTKSGIEKVSAYPYLMAFEFKSAPRNGYAMLKILPIPYIQGELGLQETWVRPAYLNCALCLWVKTKDFYDINGVKDNTTVYYRNSWSLDGASAPGSRKYKLGFGAYSNSPDNMEFRYSKSPISLW